MKKINNDNLVNIIRLVLETPNECDRNGEAANMVDGLFAIARSIEYLASIIEDKNFK